MVSATIYSQGHKTCCLQSGMAWTMCATQHHPLFLPSYLSSAVTAICISFMVFKAADGCANRFEHAVASSRRQLQQTVHNRQLQAQPEGPDISQLDDKLQQQWDYAANAHLHNVVIKPYSKRHVWWVCHQCPDGHLHRWLAVIGSRSLGSGCPQCQGSKMCKHSSLATKAPQIAAQWDFSKNTCTPDDITCRSNVRRHWQCHTCNHEWIASVNNRTRHGSGCPICSRRRLRKNPRQPSFQESQHPLLKQWDHKRNAAVGLLPDAVLLSSSRQVWWLCNSCPAGHQHSWSATPWQRIQAFVTTGCAVCAGKAACKCNSLQPHSPAIAAEWDFERNAGTPDDHVSCSTYLAWWASAKRGSWQQSITSRTNNQVSTVTGSLKVRR